MRSISQRELRNDNADVIRAVERGESLLVTKNGRPVAVIRPAEPTETDPGLPLSQPASGRADFRHWPRVALATPTSDLLDELREER